MLRPFLIAGLLGACASGGETPPAPSSQMTPGFRVLRVIEFLGACDASGAVSLDRNRFAVADDEDNVIRIYDADRGGAPLADMDLSAWLTEGEEEADLEAATRLGDLALWLASHSRSKKGKERPSRLLLVATELPTGAASPALAGTPYRGLLDALTQDPRYAGFELDRSAERPPKVPGGLNIEGLTSALGGGVLIGFRNPTPGGRALLLGLDNPEDVVRARANPVLSDPILLDLDGRGVRGLSSWQDVYLLAAGAAEQGPSDALYAWPGGGAAPEVIPLDLSGFNPEGFFTPEERSEFMLLSDDGEREFEGRPCKKLKDPGQKRFRGVWIGR